MADYLRLISLSLTLLIYFYLMLKIIMEYRIHRFTPLIYLLFVSIFLSMNLFLNFLPEPDESEFAEIFFRGSILILTACISILLVLLFFESFDRESVLTTRNVVLMISVSTLGFLMIISSILFNSLVSEDSERFSDPDNIELTGFEELLFAVIGIGILLLLLTGLIMVIILIKTVRRKMKETNNPEVRNLMRKIAIGSAIQVFGPIVIGIFNVVSIGRVGLGDILGPFVEVFGLYIMIYYFLIGGIFLFQGEALKRLIIVTEGGIPIYSYSFQKINMQEDILADSLEDRASQEILFSGAIKSISILLSEFTGSNRVVREIFLEDMVMMVNMISQNVSVILLSEKSTKFLRNALNKFSQQVVSLVEEIPLDKHSIPINTKLPMNFWKCHLDLAIINN